MGGGTQPVAGEVGRVSTHGSLHGVLLAGAPVLLPVPLTQGWGRGSCSKLPLSHLGGGRAGPYAAANTKQSGHETRVASEGDKCC